MEPLLEEAVQALNINVPIIRYQIEGKTVTLWLYGHHAPVEWTRPGRGEVPSPEAPAPGSGEAFVPSSGRGVCDSTLSEAKGPSPTRTTTRKRTRKAKTRT